MSGKGKGRGKGRGAQPAAASAAAVEVTEMVQDSEEELSSPATAATRFWLPSIFKCPLSGDLLEDPVQAEDGNTYSRKLLQEWMTECLTREDVGKEIVSPVTKKPMGTGVEVRKDVADAIAEIAVERAKRARPVSEEPTAEGEPVPKKRRTQSLSGGSSSADSIVNSANSSLNQLGAVFAHLDPMRDLLAKCLDGWEPPQLVVVGNENAGKSSVLERLCMMPIFPRDENLCTRCPIHVRLRRGPAKAPQLEVTDANGGSSQSIPISVPAECAHDDVRRTMERIVKEQNATLTGVASDRKILLHVQSPNVPTLDLVDLPGVVAAAASGEPPNMPDQTKSLVQQHISHHKNRSVYLACVDAPTAPNSSTALQILVQQQVLDKTIGVITMCDWAVAPQQKEKVNRRLMQAAGCDAVELKHGYVATMNAPVVDDSISNLEKLQQQADNELEFFKGYLPACAATTAAALLSRVEVMFLDHVKRSWIPTTLSKLSDERQSLDKQNADLGLPAAHGDGNEAELSDLRAGATKAAEELFRKGIPDIERQFSAKYVEPLHREIMAAICAEAGISRTVIRRLSPHNVEADLQAVAEKIRTVVVNHDKLKAANCDIATWVATQVKEECTSTFKLNRFPEVAAQFESKVRQELPAAKDTADILHQAIAHHLSIDGPNVVIEHDFGPDKTVTAKLTLRASRITGAILHRYMCDPFKVLAKLQNNIETVVNATLEPGTRDACDAQRREIELQIELVRRAEQGISAISQKEEEKEEDGSIDLT
eukprot:COSAG03_NODE_1504_length_3971_cov_7.241219_1_plen_768_part_00